MAVFETPWKIRAHGADGSRDWIGVLGNNWTLSGIGNYRSGLPYTMRTAGSIPMLYDQSSGQAITGLAPGMNGSGGDNRVYTVGRNTFRYPPTWKADMRLAKRFNMGQMRQLEFLAESFNLFNHQNTTELETIGYSIGSSGSIPTLTFLNGAKANTTAFGQPLSVNGTNFYRERQIQLGLRLRF
jgi:hypothetical protein